MENPILLVEDDIAHARLLMAALQAAGVPDPVVWVESVDEALSYLEGTGVYSNRGTHPLPCLILLDLNLSKLTGFHVLKRQRESPSWKGVPTIVVTGSLDPRDIDRAFELGAESYIVKPEDFSDLAEMLRFKVNLCLRRTTSMKVDS